MQCGSEKVIDFLLEDHKYKRTFSESAVDGLGQFHCVIYIFILTVNTVVLSTCAFISTGRKYVSNNELRFKNSLIRSVLHLEL